MQVEAQKHEVLTERNGSSPNMASCRRNDEGGKGVAETPPPHFFKIILPDNLKHGKLGIPKKFVRKYGNGLSNSVLLQVPKHDGVWKVKLTKHDGEIWLEKGWREFAEYYTLEHGHFLVFRYEGNSLFYVLIFDRSALEIEYPIKTSNVEKTNHDAELKVMPTLKETDADNSVEILEVIETSVSVEILDDIPPCPETAKKTALAHLPSRKKMRSIPSSRNGNTSNEQTLVSGSEPEGIPDELKLEKSKRYERGISVPPAKEGGGGMSTAQRHWPSEARGRVGSLTAEEKARALLRASDFRSENPFFVVAMQPSYVGTGSIFLYVPFIFARTYLTEGKGNIILRLLDGRTWPVQYRKHNGTCVACIHRGWTEFSQDNNLHVGDACVFELLKGPQMSLNVVIFRAIEDANCRLPAAHGCRTDQVGSKRALRNEFESDCTCRDEISEPFHHDSAQFMGKELQAPQGKIENEHGRRVIQKLSCSSVSRAFDRASKFTSNHPFFKVEITAGYLRGAGPTLPSSFRDRYIAQCSQTVTLQIRARSWPVKLVTCSDGAAKLSAGWSAFRNENNLRLGDVCVFEMIESDDIVMRVSIFRGLG